tara:strand:- start:17265 stop:18296 length:1032 start_codon:yes stop_codon:yes gene_type:complete
MKVLITGDKGYIGSILTKYLSKYSYTIIGYDTGFFESCNLSETFDEYTSIKKDIRDFESADLHNVDAIIHLAALSNDPLGELKSGITEEINRDAAIRVAEIAKMNNVKRFVYMSSQSMYGISDTSNELDEYTSEKNPLTAYAKTKWEAEQSINKLADNNFTVISLRPSTVFGVSPRIRTDIVFNNLIASAFTTKKIVIKSDGTPFRPIIHILDVCNAVKAVLEAPKTLINKRAYNIGIKNGNYTVKMLAETVKKNINGSTLVFSGEHGNDSRTYKVSFKRIFTELSDMYEPEWDLSRGANELINFFNQIKLKKEDLNGHKTNRLNMLNKITKEGKINEKFRWL